VQLRFALHDNAGSTLVRIVSDSELGGVLADFARTGGIAVANAIMADFAKRAAEEFAHDAPTMAPQEAVPLAAHRLLWVVVQTKLVEFARWLGLHVGNSRKKLQPTDREG